MYAGDDQFVFPEELKRILSIALVAFTFASMAPDSKLGPKQLQPKNSSMPASASSSVLWNRVTAKFSPPTSQRWRSFITTASATFFPLQCRTGCDSGRRHVLVESAWAQSQTRRERHHDFRADGRKEAQHERRQQR